MLTFTQFIVEAGDLKFSTSEENVLKLTGTSADQAGIVSPTKSTHYKAIHSLVQKGLVTITKSEVTRSQNIKKTNFGRSWEMGKSREQLDLRFKLTPAGEALVKSKYNLSPNRDPWVEKNGTQVHVSTLTPAERQDLGWEQKAGKWIRIGD